MNHKDFISTQKSMVIAPAGHGKTHLIADCLSHTEGKQLILTHTHAGVASIKEKLKKGLFSSTKFHVETITGYAQKYVQAFYTGTDIPDREDSEKYYSFLIEKAKVIISSPLVSKTIQVSYTGLFVDEYQDCTQHQHEFISLLAGLLPTRILGDPLQGIFNFSGTMSMVDLDDTEHMGDFHSNIYKLEEPWRWKGVNEPLGIALKDIRVEIEAKRNISLTNYPNIEYINITAPADLFNPGKQYYKVFNKILQEKNLLIIHPESSSVHPRKRVIKGFGTPITLMEAIDDKDFYKLSKLLDALATVSLEKVMYDVSLALFNKTEINKWLSAKGTKKRTKVHKHAADLLSELFARANSESSHISRTEILKYISKLEKVRCYRKELLYSLLSALEEAQKNGTTVYESMIEKRNHIRRTGRRTYGRCIGTTLLTKGLEFETVVVLNAHEFLCPKNLYVALTRARKRLIVFSTSPILSPHY